MSVLDTHLYQCTRWWCCERPHSASFAHLTMGDYKCICPHCAECSAVFDQTQCDSSVPPSLFIQSHSKKHYFVSPVKKVLKGNHFAHVEEVKRNGRDIKRHQRWQVQKLFWTVEKNVLTHYCIKWGILWRWLKVKHLRINTQSFINKFWFLWTPPRIFEETPDTNSEEYMHHYVHCNTIYSS